MSITSAFGGLQLHEAAAASPNHPLESGQQRPTDAGTNADADVDADADADVDAEGPLEEEEEDPEEAAVAAEVALQLHMAMESLTPFQQLLVREQLEQEPSRLYARLCTYVRLVAEVEAWTAAEATAQAPIVEPEPEENAGHTAHDQQSTQRSHTTAATAAIPNGVPAVALVAEAAVAAAAAAAAAAADAANAAASSTPIVAPLAPVLTHPTFQAALQDHLLQLLQERWEGVFSGSASGSFSLSEGKRISKAERAAKGLNKSSLVYGEVSFHTLGELLWGPLCASVPQSGSTFVDLGSGTGRGVLAAAALFPFSRLVGIEILEGLHAAAVDVLAHHDRAVRPCYTAPGDPRLTQKFEIACGSFLDLDWPAGADVVFANSTCFGEALMDEIAAQGQSLRDGAIFITTTRELESPYFNLVYSEAHPMSQGTATVNVHVKRTPTQQEIDEAHARKQAQRAKNRRYLALD